MKAKEDAFNLKQALEGAFSVIVKLQTSRMLVSSNGWLQYYSIGHGETEVLSVALRDHGDGGME